MRQFDYTLVPERGLDTPVHRKGWRPVRPRPRPYPKPAASVGVATTRAARRRSREDARPLVPAPLQDAAVCQDNYVGRPVNTPPFRKGWRLTKPKPRPRPYPKPAASVGASVVLAARRRSREDARPLVHAPTFQDVLVFHDNYVGRPLDTPVYRKGWRPARLRPRPYPKPTASVGAAAILAARRRSREDSRPMIPAPTDNYVGFPLVIAGYVPDGDDMEIDAGPLFTTVMSNATHGNSNSLPIGVTAAPDNGVFFNGARPGIQVIVGHVPEFSAIMEVDLEGSSIPSGNPVGVTEAPYHPVFNGPPYTGPQVIAENVFAAHLGIAGNPYNLGPHHVQVVPNAFPPDAGLVDPLYDPREPLFPIHQIIPHLNPGLQVAEHNVFMGINVNGQVPTYSVQPLAPGTLNAPSIVTAEDHPGDREGLFNELFGDDGVEEDEEGNIAPDAPWGNGGGDDLVREPNGEPNGDEDEDEDEVEIII